MNLLPVSTYIGNTVIHVPYCQFLFKRDTQLMVIGTDLSNYGHVEDVLPPLEGFRYVFIGKLNEQCITLACEIAQTLGDYHWNFENHSNPDLVVVSRIK
ncbi:hypothetical protein [Xanthocytophaga agilis]|uniref:Uncharacterized protein n=1 Tax=Xanthocytophaga agilis TaxID=3048010 RepID=A0AAE3R5G9_9BACT|nr:hypothetical protein [Xanthocytophaga agilis]MDJ1501730.1 hypothetical protein [Xanthocytophaga agilis]